MDHKFKQVRAEMDCFFCIKMSGAPAGNTTQQGVTLWRQLVPSGGGITDVPGAGCWCGPLATIWAQIAKCGLHMRPELPHSTALRINELFYMVTRASK